jgi:hypothetical protein
MKKGKKQLKALLKIVLKAIIVVLTLIGMFNVFQYWQYRSIKRDVLEYEKDIEYDILKYKKEFGKPIFWVNPAYDKTFFFIEGFRIPNSAEAWYGDWLKNFHEQHEINIVVPMYGIQGWPFKERNREWLFEEDMREVLQVYNAYTIPLKSDHKIYLASMSFGIFPNMVICALAERKPDHVILMSPLNSKLDFRVSGPVVAWIAKQVMKWPWVSQVIMFTKPQIAPNRHSGYDIVNKEASLYWASKTYTNPEDNLIQGYQSHLAAKFMEKELIPLVKNLKISMFWGDSDLLFQQEGFKELNATLSESNETEVMILKDAGHHILLDNGHEILKRKIEEIVQQ